jgi:hypothetical protein
VRVSSAPQILAQGIRHVGGLSDQQRQNADAADHHRGQNHQQETCEPAGFATHAHNGASTASSRVTDDPARVKASRSSFKRSACVTNNPCAAFSYTINLLSVTS